MLKKVLLVEDNLTDASLLHHFLARTRDKDYELVRVETLEAAIDRVSRSNFDAILLDLSLPDSQGLDTLRQMNRTAPEVAIIVLTGLDDEKIAIAALREGAQDYLVKGEIQSNLLIRAIYYAIERKQMLAQLQASEIRYRCIVEDQSEFICRFLPNGTITFANEAYCRYVGKQLQELLGHRFVPQIPPEDRESLQAHLAAIAPHNPTQTIEHRVLLPDGEVRWQQWIDRGIFDSQGRVIEYQSVGRDITELKQAQETLQRQLAREQTIALVTQCILESFNLSEILQTAVDRARNFLACERTLIQQFMPDGSAKVVAESLQPGWSSTLGWTIAEAGTFEGLECVQTREEIDRLAGVHQWPQELLETFAVKSQLIIPIWVTTQPENDSHSSSTPICLWGGLAAHRCTKIKPWQELEVSLLEHLSNQLAIAIQQSQLYQNLKAANQELQLLASVDGLTQVANRRCFDEYLEGEWRRSVKEQLPLSLILCDIDFFKRYNDYYGHLAGDECLKQVVGAIEGVVRSSSDLVARYGGEEFVVLLPKTDERKALQIAQRITAQVRALNIPHARSKVSDRVTLSLGVTSTIPTAQTRALQLVALADRALYEAKALGRDCLVQKFGLGEEEPQRENAELDFGD